MMIFLSISKVLFQSKSEEIPINCNTNKFLLVLYSFFGCISDLKLTVKNGHSNSSLVTSVGNQLVMHTEAFPIPTQLFCFTVSVSNISYIWQRC